VVTTGAPAQESTTLSLLHTFSLSGLTPGTTYYYIVSSADAAGNRATSSQGSFTTSAAADTTPPTVSGTDVTVNTTSAALSFTTNESARARVWLSTTSPVLTGESPVIDENSFSTAHSASLSGLLPNTLYHYIISVVDSAGNRATTSDATFTTSVPADTTAPVISGITAATTTSSAAISWTTNESTNGTLYVAQTTPVNTATASTVLVSIFATTHQASLSGLTSSTTYHYLIVARDTAGNTATSSEHRFIID
jgi:chitodextrinase